jgi:RNA polymerase sigma-70 factor (ECF subfamily)
MPAAEAQRAFERLAQPFRRELDLHCYRLMGSLHEAEDLVQETYLRAWRHFDRFEGGSFRAWLYRIATNACLNALERRTHAQRVLPDQLGPASATMPPGAPATEVAWLEPYPDSRLEGIADAAHSPEARFSTRESVRLAFVAALQLLPPRQRAALLLCDVVGCTAAEAAAMLDSSTASITSALQRARGTLASRSPDGPPPEASPPSPEQQQLLGEYLKAWEAHDVDRLGVLLAEDASLAMPPWLEWYVGRETLRSFFGAQWKTCGGLRLVPTAANGQPAFAVYERGADGHPAAHSLQVLTLAGDTVSALTLFVEPRLVPAFGLPLVLPEAGRGRHLAAPR